MTRVLFTWGMPSMTATIAPLSVDIRASRSGFFSGPVYCPPSSLTLEEKKPSLNLWSPHLRNPEDTAAAPGLKHFWEVEGRFGEIAFLPRVGHTRLNR